MKTDNYYKTKLLIKVISIASLVTLTACNGGNQASGSSANSVNNANEVTTSIDMAKSGQTITPTSAYQLISSAAVASGNSCFSLVATPNGKNYTSTQNSGQYYSTATVSYTIQNTCSTAQSISGLVVNINDLTINGSLAPINYVAQSQSNPYLSVSYTTSGNNVVMTISTPPCSGNYCSWAQMPAGATNTITLNEYANTAINSFGVGSISISGNTPVPTPTPIPSPSAAPTPSPKPSPTPSPAPLSGNLSINVNTSALATICTSSVNCKISVNLLDPTNAVIQTITVNPVESPNYTVLYKNLLLGNYTLAVNTNSYPSGSAGSIAYTYTPSNGIAQVNSNVTTNTVVNFNYTAPKQIGSLTINTANVSENTFTNIGTLSGTATDTTTNIKYSFTVGLNSSYTLNNLPAGDTYNITLQGIGDPATGIYYSVPGKQAKVVANTATNVSLQFSKVSAGLNSVVFTVTGAPSNQNITFADSDATYKYNTDALMSATYKFLSSELAVAVTIPTPSGYSLSYTPAVITPSVKSFTATYTQSSGNTNPYTGTSMYINPDYQAEVNTFLSANPLYQAKAQPYLDGNKSWNISTAVWIDRIAAIDGYSTTHGVAWHLQQAYQQALKSSKPVSISLVVYDLPNRDCAAYSSNGEIVIPASDTTGTTTLTNEYEAKYINPLNAAINSFYAANPDAKNKVKTILLIEPDSLPNVITNKALSSCQLVSNYHVYERGVAYALKAFNTGASAGSIYMYLDLAHSGWLGWTSNANQIYTVFNNNEPTTTTGGLGSGFNNIRGFVVNTANYTPLKEAFTYAAYLQNNSIISSSFYQWNDVYSLDSYIAEIMSIDSSSKMVAQQNGHQIVAPSQPLYKNMHFLVDTSRNGWKSQSFTTDDGKSYQRNDLRHHNGNWCNIQNIVLSASNIASPGMGAVPQADPVLSNPLYSGLLPIDAYIWVKPPGESDGSYNSTTGSGDQMCGNGTGGDHNNNSPTDALQNGSSPAPKAGAWFDAAFIKLLTNS